jgi:hypothetical protein
LPDFVGRVSLFILNPNAQTPIFNADYTPAPGGEAAGRAPASSDTSGPHNPMAPAINPILILGCMRISS